ncbi:MAG: LPXTG cell wall anchor domain-containing protein [Clostridia bacterium]|nr:LPXTG cell wall anchor domain-containing protein [Clostridia bacterium]
MEKITVKTLKTVKTALLCFILTLLVVGMSGYKVNAAIHRFDEGEVFEIPIGGILQEKAELNSIKNIAVDTETTTANVKVLSIKQADDSENVIVKCKALSYGYFRLNYQRYGYSFDSNGSWEDRWNALYITPIVGAKEERTLTLKNVKLSNENVPNNIKDIKSANPDILEFLSAKNVKDGVEVTVRAKSAGMTYLTYKSYFEDNWYNDIFEIKTVSGLISEDIKITANDIKIGTDKKDIKLSGYNSSDMDLENVYLLNSKGDKTDKVDSKGTYTLVAVFKAKGAMSFKESNDTQNEYAGKITVNAISEKGYIGLSATDKPSVVYDFEGEYKYLLVEHKFEVKGESETTKTPEKNDDSAKNEGNPVINKTQKPTVSPKTGDNGNIYFWAFASGFSMLAIAFFIAKRKHEN